MRKVNGRSRSPNLERSPSIVGGREERFFDIGKMISQWEEMEGIDQEWKVEEGRQERQQED